MLGQTTAVLVALAAFITSEIILLALALGRLSLAGAADALLVEAVHAVGIIVLIVVDGTFIAFGLASGVAYQ